jgi:hypothetical protein
LQQGQSGFICEQSGFICEQGRTHLQGNNGERISRYSHVYLISRVGELVIQADLINIVFLKYALSCAVRSKKKHCVLDVLQQMQKLNLHSNTLDTTISKFMQIVIRLQIFSKE